jgi:hypothetical protein
VDLDAQPFHLEIELLLQPFDKSLADVAERSDVIGEDAHRYAHGYIIPLFTGKEEERGGLCESGLALEAKPRENACVLAEAQSSQRKTDSMGKTARQCSRAKTRSRKERLSLRV